MNKKSFLSSLIVLIVLLAGYELYTGYKGRQLLTAAHFVQGLSLATPIKMQVVEYYMTQGEFPDSNAELGLPSSQYIRSRSVKNIEVSTGGKITIAYNSVLKDGSSIVLTPTIPLGPSAQSIEWVCMTETIKQAVLDNISIPCFYSPPGMMNDLMDSIVVSSEAQARAAITAGVDVNGSLHGDTPLLAAIARDRYAIMQQLIKAGANVNHKSVLYKGLTPLIHASRLGREKMSNLLLDNGANIDEVDNNGKSALMHAAKIGRKNIIKFLLSRGANPTLLDKRGRDAVYYARKHGRRTGNGKLIEAAALRYSAILEQSGYASKVSDLMRAAAEDDLEKVKQLIYAKVSVNEVDGQNATALHYSVRSRNVLVARELIDAGIDVNGVDRDENTPLLLAVKNRANKIVGLLLKHGAMVNVRNRYHNSPLILAVRYGHKDIVGLLLNAGAKESANVVLYESFVSPASKESRLAIQQLIIDSKLNVNDDGKSLVDLLVRAIKVNRITIVRFLLDRGVKLDLDLDGKSLPLHVAAQLGAYEVAEMLVGHGANINTVNKQGKTALMFAVESRQIRLITYLLKSGANVNVIDANGLTALRIAKANYSEDVVKLLRRYNKKQAR
jgi:ankyrin repeat protein